MKRTIAIGLAALILTSMDLAQTTPPQTPGRVIETPFGSKVIDAPPEPPAPVTAPAPPAVTPPAPAPPAVAPIPQAPAQAAPAPAQDDSAAIALHMDGADIYQVIRIIGENLGISYVIDPSVKGSVNISTSTSLRKSDLMPILETILKINGATMVKVGNFYQIMPANTATHQPIEVHDSETTAPDDQMVMQVVRMKYVSASEMAQLLSGYVGEGGNITVHESGNILLITDRRSNLKKLLDIIDIFDTNALEGERIKVFTLTSALARDVADDLKTIFNGYALSDKTSAIRFIPIVRLNSILVVTPNAVILPEVEKWVGRLDQAVQTSGSRNYVYNVRNAKAEDIQRVLSQLYDQADTGSDQTAAASSALAPPGTNSPPPAGATPQAASLPQSSGSLPGNSGTALTSGTPAPQPSRPNGRLRGGIRIIADEVNNSLVIQARPQEYAEIENTIRQLDILRRQVLIDAQIYEVVLDNSLSFGVSARLQARDTLANPQTTASFESSGTGPASLAGQTFAFIGRTRELVAFLNASENRSRVKTLSAPSVLVTDNMTAQFQVGSEVPIPTSSSVTPVQSGGTNLFAQTIQFRNTGVILQVRPQINDSGNVTLDISQEVSQAAANTVSAIVAPVIGKSSVTSTVVVENGQTIAIGGFIRENSENVQNRIPLIGRVPVLGAVLGNTQKNGGRTELIVLITPHVLRTHEDADDSTEELKAKLKELKLYLPKN